MKDSGARIVLGFFVTDRELETPQGRVRTQEREQSLPSLHVSPYLWIQPTLIENIWGENCVNTRHVQTFFPYFFLNNAVQQLFTLLLHDYLKYMEG
jgi:hypothetical protein